MLRGVFKTELSDIAEEAHKLERRLRSLHDLAEDDGLQEEIVRRLGSKATVLEHLGNSLLEIPAMAEGGARS